jgi:hypothetical protein
VPQVIRRACALAARRSALRSVPCPTIVPAGPAHLQYAGEIPGYQRSYQISMGSPSIDSPRSGGHWAVEGGVPAALDRTLAEATGLPVQPLKVRGGVVVGQPVRILWVRGYGGGGGFHGGHVVVRWKHGRLAFQVSLHGHHNEERARLMARGLMRALDP